MASSAKPHDFVTKDSAFDNVDWPGSGRNSMFRPGGV